MKGFPNNRVGDKRPVVHCGFCAKFDFELVGVRLNFQFDGKLLGKLPIPTEPVGSIPRPPDLLAAMRAHTAGQISHEQFRTVEDAALRDTITRLEETGSPVITDGEQTKPSFATYPLTGLGNLAADGVTIRFADGHTRQLPRLTGGPFRYSVHAETYLRAAQRYARRPLKQAVISASALSLLYPPEDFPDYSREAFIEDLTKRTGFYLAVTREGEVGADDEIKLIARDPNAVPVSEITRLYIAKRYGDGEVSSIRRALRVVALPESWKAYFQERLQMMGIAVE